MVFCWGGNISTACVRVHSPDLLSAELQSVAQQAQHPETHCSFMAAFASFFGHFVCICHMQAYDRIFCYATIIHDIFAAQPCQCLTPFCMILPGARAAKVPKRTEATPAAVPVQPSQVETKFLTKIYSFRLRS